MTASNTHQSRIDELDGLRAIAIALVIGCHYNPPASAFGGLPEFGWVGVDVFFVLSGYLITTNLLALRGTRGAYRTFYRRRIRRIFPPYFLVVAVLALAYFAIAGRVSLPLLFFQSAFLTSFLHSSQVFATTAGAIKGWSLPALFTSVSLPVAAPGVSLHTLRDALGATWSLSIEEWFYIVWAPIVLAFARRGILVATIPALLLGLILRWANASNGFLWYQDFFCRFDMLTLGAGLALWLNLRHSRSEPAQRRGDQALTIAGLLALVLLGAMVLTSPFLGREIRCSPMFAAFGPPLIAVLVASIIASLVQQKSVPLCARILRSSPFVWIGRRSYMIYLAHLPWYWITCSMFGTTGRSSWQAALIALVLTLATATLSWEFLERPLLMRGRDTSDDAQARLQTSS